MQFHFLLNMEVFGDKTVIRMIKTAGAAYVSSIVNLSVALL